MNKPFVYLFKYLNEFYMFDVNKNCIVELSKDLYIAIKELASNISDVENLKCNPNIKNCISNLIQKGFISSNRSKIVENPLSSFMKDHLENNLKGMILQMSQNCNLKCRYCIYSGNTLLSRSHEKKNMTWDTAKRALDFFIQHSVYSKEVSFGFYGGEPMLAFPIIKQSVLYVQRQLFDKQINFQMTTNGTLFTDKSIDFLIKNNFQLTISLDGPEEIHNENRRFSINGRGSYATIINNLERIKKIDSNYFQRNVSINSVVSDPNNWNEIKNYFEKDPLFASNSVSLNPVSDTYLFSSYISTNNMINKKKMEFDILMGNVFKYKTNYFGEAALEVARLKQQFSEMSPLPEKTHHQGPCLPGYRRLFVDIYGDFRVCEKASEKSSHLIIGNIKKGFDYDTVYSLLNIGKLTENKCLKCHAIRHCRICPVEIDSVTELSKDIKNNLCKYNNKSFIADMKKFIIYRKLGLI